MMTTALLMMITWTFFFQISDLTKHVSLLSVRDQVSHVSEWHLQDHVPCSSPFKIAPNLSNCPSPIPWTIMDTAAITLFTSKLNKEKQRPGLARSHQTTLIFFARDPALAKHLWNKHPFFLCQEIKNSVDRLFNCSRANGPFWKHVTVTCCKARRKWNQRIWLDRDTCIGNDSNFPCLNL